MSILDYAKKYGHITYKEHSFDEIDNLILSNVIYCNYKKGFAKLNNPSSTTLEKLLFSSIDDLDLRKETCGLLLGKNPLRLAKRIYGTKRYGHIIVSDFVQKQNPEISQQFAAICYHLSPKTIYLCFRGTDDTLHGWMENLNLITEKTIPSEIEAQHYINQMMNKYPHQKFIIGGHSKGGNLAVYGATYCDDKYKSRIKKIYSIDGNGFFPHTFDDQRFKQIEKKTFLMAPTHCLVGRLLYQPIKQKIIVKTKKTGLLCHDVHNWIVENDELVTTKYFSRRSHDACTEINHFATNLSKEKRLSFCQDFAHAINESHVETLISFLKNPSSGIIISWKLSLSNQLLILKFIRILLINKFGLN